MVARMPGFIVLQECECTLALARSELRAVLSKLLRVPTALLRMMICPDHPNCSDALLRTVLESTCAHAHAHVRRTLLLNGHILAKHQHRFYDAACTRPNLGHLHQLWPDGHSADQATEIGIKSSARSIWSISCLMLSSRCFSLISDVGKIILRQGKTMTNPSTMKMIALASSTTSNGHGDWITSVSTENEIAVSQESAMSKPMQFMMMRMPRSERGMPSESCKFPMNLRSPAWPFLPSAYSSSLSNNSMSATHSAETTKAACTPNSGWLSCKMSVAAHLVAL
mmetsp:Transcript_8931/g.22484  ORF Transcript_8931/g.22484 Transcript_8931/m.22484 type:complete len:282 (+) Transcript_8931:76-921(+)